jgi:hypothetical protein
VVAIVVAVIGIKNQWISKAQRRLRKREANQTSTELENLQLPLIRD